MLSCPLGRVFSVDAAVLSVDVLTGLGRGVRVCERGSIVTRSIDRVSCMPSIPIVTVDGDAVTTRNGLTDFDRSFGWRFVCALHGAALWFHRVVEFA